MKDRTLNRWGIVSIALAVLVAWSIPSEGAAKKKCPPNCKHRRPVECAKAPAPSPGLWRDVVGGLELRGGFRWDRDVACPVCPTPVPAPGPAPANTMHDPPFIGLGLSLPLSRSADVRGSFDYDLDGPHNGKIGSARVELAWHPWRK